MQCFYHKIELDGYPIIIEISFVYIFKSSRDEHKVALGTL